ncbi:alpha-amylase family glycosyl hydrolase, partial [Salmonella enterica]|nr:alpha-amylase family glycosyl hydrolase [Salmonella enterica]
IQEGNILHCFDWKMQDVKSELANIAAAGFGAVQLSPLQRTVSGSDTWYDAYRPYDFAFKQSVFGSADDLKALCVEADKYGVKVVVDVVFNHVDSKGYHDSWWDSSGRTRSEGDIDYNSRYSITHGQLGGAGGYPDCNSESADVAARAKEYVEFLKGCGVDGIRFDAAKHVGLPSEGCSFWSTVTSVSGLYYYGEILDNPGGDRNTLMKEYANYMSVTDNGYGDNTRENGGVPTGGYAGWGAGIISQDRCVYWGESHDTYANDGGASKYDSQDVVDRAYAIVACRKSETALYLSRPATTDGGSMKCGQKGSTHFTSKCVAEVNKFRNAMVGKADYYTVSGGVACV